MTAKERIDAAAVEILDPYVRKIKDEKYGWKYGCGAKGCTKLFHAAEFVHKHLRLKHPDLVMELTSKVREDLYFQNYMNYNKSLKHRPFSDDYLRDELGNRRLYDRVKNDDMYDRAVSSTFHDSLFNFNRSKKGNHDEPISDAYGGQWLHGILPFSSDIPPPVLIPLPGAGPLPPETAMRMLREQGDPSPYEKNDGPRDSKGPSQQLGAMAPKDMPPAFRHDPQRIRRLLDGVIEDNNNRKHLL